MLDASSEELDMLSRELYELSDLLIRLSIDLPLPEDAGDVRQRLRTACHWGLELLGESAALPPVCTAEDVYALSPNREESHACAQS